MAGRTASERTCVPRAQKRKYPSALPADICQPVDYTHKVGIDPGGAYFVEACTITDPQNGKEDEPFLMKTPFFKDELARERPMRKIAGNLERHLQAYRTAYPEMSYQVSANLRQLEDYVCYRLKRTKPDTHPLPLLSMVILP